MARRSSREKKKKTVNWDLIDPGVNSGPERQVYRMIKQIVKECYPDLLASDCRIGAAWRTNWKADASGRVRYIHTILVKDPFRQRMALDVILVVNREIWQEADFTDDMKAAAIDEGLAGLQVAKDGDSSLKKDQLERYIYQKRNPDVITYSEVASRRGPWHEKLKDLAESLHFAEKEPLFEQASAGKADPERTKEVSLPLPVAKKQKPIHAVRKTQA